MDVPPDDDTSRMAFRPTCRRRNPHSESDGNRLAVPNLDCHRRVRSLLGRYRHRVCDIDATGTEDPHLRHRAWVGSRCPYRDVALHPHDYR